MELLINVIGWVGSVTLISAYLMVSKKKIDSQSRTYQGLNILASTCLIINTGYYGAYPATALNVVWVFIGLYFLTQIVSGKMSTETSSQ